MNGEVSQEQAEKIIAMLTEGGAIENVNAPLALRLIPLAEELDNLELVERLLEHANSSAADELESGWVKFEKLRYNNSSIDNFVELAAIAEKITNGSPLAAAVLHHVGYYTLVLNNMMIVKYLPLVQCELEKKLMIKQV